MRLDLRVLLNYLDEKLEPAQAKALGAKIEQSAAARKVVQRIQEVISRRDLTIPLSGVSGAPVDPNAIAGYLDGVLSPERTNEVEEICLASNRYLAEIATCHQILGSARGETLEPRIYRRIYGLVKEAKPAEPATTVVTGPSAPAGPYRRRLLTGVSAALILIGGLLAGAYYLARDWWKWSPNSVEESNSGNSVSMPQLQENLPAHPFPEKMQSAEKANVSVQAKPGPGPEEKKHDQPLGQFLLAKGIPGVLLKRHNDNQLWEVLQAGTAIAVEDRLLCLPGFSAELDLNTEIRLRLAGNLPDDSPFLESEVALRSNLAADLDLALFRGRVAIANHKPQSSVRLRFLDEVWDLELKTPETEIALESWSVYPSGFPFHKGLPAEEPMAGLNLFVIKGSAKLKIRYDTHDLQGPPGPCFFPWNNIGPLSRQAKSLTKLPPWTAFPPSVPDEARQVLEDLQKRLETADSIESAFEATLYDAEHFVRLLGVFDLAAVDSLTPLLDTWEDPKQPAGIRISAAAALRHWMGRNAGKDLRLYQAFEKKYSPETAETLMVLLHGFSAKQAQEPATYQKLIGGLKHELLPVRELAFAQLFALVPEGRKIPFDPAGDAAQRNRAFEEWRKLIPDGQLPPNVKAKKESEPIP